MKENKRQPFINGLGTEAFDNDQWKAELWQKKFWWVKLI